LDEKERETQAVQGRMEAEGKRHRERVDEIRALWTRNGRELEEYASMGRGE
jgi:hypothetical protein